MPFRASALTAARDPRTPASNHATIELRWPPFFGPLDKLRNCRSDHRKLIRHMSTKAKRKRHSAAFKAKVGMDAVLGIKTTAQIAREHGVHPVQVSQWKAVIRDRLPELFEAGGKPAEDSERLVADLHRKIGELTVDLDYLKKKSKQLGL